MNPYMSNNNNKKQQQQTTIANNNSKQRQQKLTIIIMIGFALTRAASHTRLKVGEPHFSHKIVQSA
jgi:hypothetical protein